MSIGKHIRRARGLWGELVPRSNTDHGRLRAERDRAPVDADTRPCDPRELVVGDQVHRHGSRWTVSESRRAGLWAQRIVLECKGRASITLYLTPSQPLNLYPRSA